MKPALFPIVSLVLALSVGGCGQKKPTANKEKEEAAHKAPSETGAGNPLTAPVDYLGAVGAAQKQAARFADLNPLGQAIRAFHAGEDRMPANLQELVTEGYLPKLPTPPRGMALAYNPGTGQVKYVPVDPGTAPAPGKPGR